MTVPKDPTPDSKGGSGDAAVTASRDGGPGGQISGRERTVRLGPRPAGDTPKHCSPCVTGALKVAPTTAPGSPARNSSSGRERGHAGRWALARPRKVSFLQVELPLHARDRVFFLSETSGSGRLRVKSPAAAPAFPEEPRTLPASARTCPPPAPLPLDRALRTRLSPRSSGHGFAIASRPAPLWPLPRARDLENTRMEDRVHHHEYAIRKVQPVRNSGRQMTQILRKKNSQENRRGEE
ncbi:uncharacterized protein LOC122686668 [Cervus elaphus]|uniref:uncharacterized protein LOC122686668 n=1 Tax=Cervus elaphus TaxID=9860 RepID=UPI001CC2BDF2|nr:uncharacterized protein LOC122686668 [Cervus elaphus]